MSRPLIGILLFFALGGLVLGYSLLNPAPGPGGPTAEAPPPGDAAGGAAIVDVALPETLSAEARIGQRIFDVACSSCHGENAAGQDGVAPPLVHRIYEPSHHADEAFQIAVRNGVRAHHWTFGNMPPVEGLSRADVQAVVTYIRELQHANDIF